MGIERVVTCNVRTPSRLELVFTRQGMCDS